MIYQETIKIETNKAKRILELCKTRGIEIYDLFANSWSKSARFNDQRLRKQEKQYQARYMEWYDFTRDKIREIFLTPRILIEFDNKCNDNESFESKDFQIKTHLETALDPQIYFIEVVFNECDYYNILEDTPSLRAPIKKTLARLFNVEGILSANLNKMEKGLLN